MIDTKSIKRGDSVYIYSSSLISRMIVWVSTGGKYTKNIPSHEAKVFDIYRDFKPSIQLIEVVFSGKRYCFLEDYVKKGCKVWVKRDTGTTEENVNRLLGFLQTVKVQRYDWGLIAGFLARFILRKIFPRKWNFDWVTKVWDSKICFVCSEFINSGRRFTGMNVKENETPSDNFRKIPAQEITST